ncbi:MAG: hypothetical protein IT374_27915 [Polyangiaceae bacterium]|nr:hypothetical protein [Polyangiaceae bacterium]
MNATTKQQIANATLTASQARSRWGGTPEPEIEVRYPRGTSHRRLHAALHLIAAEVEVSTPAGERWCVQIDSTSDERGRVYLELSDGTPAEAKRGLDLLRKVVAG